MNRFNYLAVIVLFCIGFIACEKENLEDYSVTPTVNSNFYRHSKAGGDEYKDFVLKFLSQVDDSIPFSGNFVTTYGLPQWDLANSYGVGDIPSLIIPVLDKESSQISSLFYFVLENGKFDYYVLMNDRDDIAYETSKRLIQYYELNLGLERSNTDFFIKLDSLKKGSKTKTQSMQAMECYYYYYVGTVDDPYQELHAHECVASADYNFETDRGDWDSSLAGTGSTEEDPKPANGGGGTSDPNTEPLPLPVPAPEVPIESIEVYLDCIDSSLPATLTIYVDQPIANENVANSGITVGHTFIGISQNGNMSIFGFYPEGMAKPTNTTHGSALGNDQDHEFDVSISKTISRTELISILSYIYRSQNFSYDLNDFNCTDFGINVGNRAGMGLPDTYNSWIGGGGSNPGSLGQDIRNMQLPSGATRSTISGNSPQNIKTCVN